MSDLAIFILQVMKPLELVTKLTSESKRSTVSMILPLHHQLLAKYQEGDGTAYCAAIREVRKNIYSDLFKR